MLVHTENMGGRIYSLGVLPLIRSRVYVIGQDAIHYTLEIPLALKLEDTIEATFFRLGEPSHNKEDLC